MNIQSHNGQRCRQRHDEDSESVVQSYIHSHHSSGPDRAIGHRSVCCVSVSLRVLDNNFDLNDF